MEITKEMLELINFPMKYLDATLDGVCEDVQKPVLSYLENARELLSMGVGLYIWGSLGSGKTATACLIQRSLLRAGIFSFFIHATDVSKYIIEKTPFQDSTFYEQMLSVPLLVIDELQDAQTTKVYGPHVEKLCRDRILNNKSVIITSNMSLIRFEKSWPSLYSVCLENLYPILIKTKDRRRDNAKILQTIFEGK